MQNKYGIAALFLVVIFLSIVSVIFLTKSHSSKTSQGMQVQHAGIISPTIAVTPDTGNDPPTNVAAFFYTAYQNCLKAGRSFNTSQTQIQYCETNTGLTLQSFKNDILAQATNSAGLDPVFCAVAPPADLIKDLTLGSASYTDTNTALVPIVETYPDKSVTITLTLQKDSLNQWRVAKVACK